MFSRCATVLLWLAAAAAAEPELFDPSRHKLSPWHASGFSRLSPEKRLRARGFDPALYVAAPAEADARLQAQNIRHKLFRGFLYEQRLTKKQRAFGRALARIPPRRYVELLRSIHEMSPGDFARNYMHMAGGLDLSGRIKTQPVQALRHSERQYHAWVLEEIAARISELDPVRRAAPLDGLVRGLDGRDSVHRRLCARVLGAVSDTMAASALERAVETEQEGAVLAELVRARARHGGDLLPVLFERWAGHESETVRVAVMRACRTAEGEWPTALLRRRLAAVGGRTRDEAVRALEVRTRTEVDFDAPATFYGIGTYSSKILYCIDISGSMVFPMDGKGGRREPRIKKTKRELLRSVSELPSGTLFNIVLFARGQTLHRTKLVPASPRTRDAALDFVEHTGLQGGTNVYGVLDYALRSGADTVFLLTDGEPNTGAIVDPALIVAEIAARSADLGATIHTIGLSQDQNAELLVNLAHRTGGKYVAVR